MTCLHLMTGYLPKDFSWPNIDHKIFPSQTNKRRSSYPNGPLACASFGLMISPFLPVEIFSATFFYAPLTGEDSSHVRFPRRMWSNNTFSGISLSKIGQFVTEMMEKESISICIKRAHSTPTSIPFTWNLTLRHCNGDPPERRQICQYFWVCLPVKPYLEPSCEFVGYIGGF